MAVWDLCLFLTVQGVFLQCVIVAFPGHTHIVFMLISGDIKIQLYLFIAISILIKMIDCMQNIIYFNPFCHRGIFHIDFCVNYLKNFN